MGGGGGFVALECDCLKGNCDGVCVSCMSVPARVGVYVRECVCVCVREWVSVYMCVSLRRYVLSRVRA